MTQTTPERIIETSLRLFNEHGFQNVPAALIAREVGISAGNLAYHFKSKRDIVVAVFPLISKEVRDVKPPDGEFFPKDGAHRQLTIFRNLWRYRFFFNGLLQLLNTDRKLRTSYTQLQDSVLQTIETLFDELVEQGYFRDPVPPVTTRLIALDIWMVWLSWLRFEQLENPRRKTPSDEALYRGAMMNFTILQQYLPAEFSVAMLAELRRELKVKNAGSASSQTRMAS